MPEEQSSEVQMRKLCHIFQVVDPVWPASFYFFWFNLHSLFSIVSHRQFVPALKDAWDFRTVDQLPHRTVGEGLSILLVSFWLFKNCIHVVTHHRGPRAVIRADIAHGPTLGGWVKHCQVKRPRFSLFAL